MKEEISRHKREIRLLAMDLTEREYIELMRDLSSWAESEAERIEFELELREWEKQ